MEKAKRNHITTVIDDVISSFKAWLLPLLLVIFSKPGTGNSGFVTRYIRSVEIKYAILILAAVLIFLFAFAKWYRVIRYTVK